MDLEALEASVSWYRQLAAADARLTNAERAITTGSQADLTSVGSAEWQTLADAARSFGKAAELGSLSVEV